MSVYATAGEIYGIDPTASGTVQYSDWSSAVVPEDLAENEYVLQQTIRNRTMSKRAFRI